MDNGTLSAADVALLNRNNGFGDGNAFLWIFALLILAGGGFNGGFGFGGNGNTEAIQADVNRGFDNQNLQAQTRDILTAVTNGTAQGVAATNQSFHDTLGVVTDKYSELARDIAGLAVGQANALANQNECCCSTKMLIAENAAQTNAQIAQSKYDTSMQMAQMEARLTAKMDANEIQNLRDQISQLQLSQATNGVLRFPSSWSYGAGAFPPIFGCCGQQNI